MFTKMEKLSMLSQHWSVWHIFAT